MVFTYVDYAYTFENSRLTFFGTQNGGEPPLLHQFSYALKKCNYSLKVSPGKRKLGRQF